MSLVCQRSQVPPPGHLASFLHTPCKASAPLHLTDAPPYLTAALLAPPESSALLAPAGIGQVGPLAAIVAHQL